MTGIASSSLSPPCTAFSSSPSCTILAPSIVSSTSGGSSTSFLPSFTSTPTFLLLSSSISRSIATFPTALPAVKSTTLSNPSLTSSGTLSSLASVANVTWATSRRSTIKSMRSCRISGEVKKSVRRERREEEMGDLSEVGGRREGAEGRSMRHEMGLSVTAVEDSLRKILLAKSTARAVLTELDFMVSHAPYQFLPCISLSFFTSSPLLDQSLETLYPFPHSLPDVLSFSTESADSYSTLSIAWLPYCPFVCF